VLSKSANGVKKSRIWHSHSERIVLRKVNFSSRLLKIHLFSTRREFKFYCSKMYESMKYSIVKTDENIFFAYIKSNRATFTLQKM
jgi:hypothetical protein